MIGAFSGDWHYGLSVEDLDRTPEVHAAVEEFVSYAIKRQVDFVSIGGDPTDNNTPLPDHIAMLISVLNRLEEAEIPTFFMKGNHEAISSSTRLWGLTPLERVGYQNIHFILEPKVMKYGEITFLFLPHATRAQAIAAGFKSAQEYIDARAEALLKDIEGKATVISHYNVNGAKAGTEALMLRQSDLQLPAIVQRSPKVVKIVNSHIHTAQEKGKLIMPGSLVCTDFGDLESPKGFLVGTYKGSKWEFETVPSNPSPMQEIELNLVNSTQEEIRKEVARAAKDVLKDSIVKVRVLIDEENLAIVDFDKMRDEIGKKARFVKQLDRIVMKKRSVRDKEQKPTLNPVEAVKRYLEVRKPEGMDRKLALALRFLDGEKVEKQESGAEFTSETAAMDALDENLEKLDRDIELPEFEDDGDDDLIIDEF